VSPILPPPRRVLIVSLRFLGDALLSTPLAAAAKREWAGCEVHMLVFKGTESMLEGNAHIDRVLAVEQRPGKAALWRQLRELWNRYDLAFITQPGTRPFLYGWFSSRRTVAPITPEAGKGWWKRLLLWKHVRWNLNGARFLENEQLMQAIGAGSPPAPTAPTAGLDRAALSKLAGADLARPYVVLHPSPRWRYKRWTDAGWRSVIRALLDRGLTVVVTGGPGDEERRDIERITDGLAGPQLVSLQGQLSLAGSADLIRGARLYIGVDTATTHIAAATGTPTVAIFGPTDPSIWGPWPREGGRPYQRVASVQSRGQVRLIQNPVFSCQPCQKEGCERHAESPSACLDALPPEQVLAQATELLAAHAEEPR
jgi:heptosyltransferase-3